MNKLSKILKIRPELPRKTRLLMAAFAAILPGLSYGLIGENSAITPEHPGGNFFEISFWITSVGVAVLSFWILEILFRSQDVRILAPWPVPPRDLFAHQMKRIYYRIFLSSALYLLVWLPYFLTTPTVTLLSFLIWPFSLSLCASMASAIILYTGDLGTHPDHRGAQFSAIAFGMAPAIALAVTLMTTLLFKLLAEALLKPHFFDAALTASSILAGLLMASHLYAARLFKKRYYAILAGFLDSDRLQLNENYAFIQGEFAQSLRQTTRHDVLMGRALFCMYGRRYPMTLPFHIVFALILGLFLWNTPESLNHVYGALVACVPWFVFSKPWSAFRRPEFCAELLAVLPIQKNALFKGRLYAITRLFGRHVSFPALAVAVPAYVHMGIKHAAFLAIFVIGVCAVGTLLALFFLPRGQQTAQP